MRRMSLAAGLEARNLNQLEPTKTVFVPFTTCQWNGRNALSTSIISNLITNRDYDHPSLFSFTMWLVLYLEWAFYGKIRMMIHYNSKHPPLSRIKSKLFHSEQS